MILALLKQNILRFYSFWTGLNYSRYVLFSIFLTIVLVIPIGILMDFLGISESEAGGPESVKNSIWDAIILGILIAPIFETLTGQMLPVKIIQRYVKWNTNRVAVTVSSLLFALGHISYSFWYCLVTLPLGFVLAITYITFQKRQQSAFWTTTIIHAGRNSLALLASLDEWIK